MEASGLGWSLTRVLQLLRATVAMVLVAASVGAISMLTADPAPSVFLSRVTGPRSLTASGPVLAPLVEPLRSPAPSFERAIEVATKPPVVEPGRAPSAKPAARSAVPAHGVAAPSSYGCGPALAWLETHAAPGFKLVCPGYALGHQAMTCLNVVGVCPNNMRLIVIDVPCAAAYKNEAWNSWIVAGLRRGPIDPYGYCH